MPTLLAVPNVSEGRDAALMDEIAGAFVGGGLARLLDVHSDPDHHRSVFTLAVEQGGLAAVMLAGARVAFERLDVMNAPRARERGVHPHVGALDVAPVVYLDTSARGAACAEALVLAHEIGERGVPVLLYGELAQGRARADLRRGGVAGLAARLEAKEMRPDFGPARLHPTAGATLVAAREPLVAFNLELASPASVKDARRIAGLIREGGAEGLPGLRAIGVELRAAGVERGSGQSSAHDPAPSVGPIAQVSTNVERPFEVPLRTVVEAVCRHADVARAELVGLAPRAALLGFPADVPWRGGDAEAQTIENALGF